MKKINKILLILILSITIVNAKENKQKYKDYAYEQVIKMGWSIEDYNNLVKLWQKESGWRVKAKNGKYYGICQTTKSNYGKKYNDYKVQINWGLKYIKSRHKNPTNAWKFWKKRKWY